MKGLSSFAIGAILIFVGSSQGDNPKVVCTTPGSVMADPNDCHYYYYCSENLVPEHHACPPGYYFDEPTVTCSLPPVTCAGSVTSSTAAPTTTTYTGYDCKHPSQIVPYPYDCETFFICDENLYPAHTYRCDPGFYYDPAYGNCNSLENVICSSGQRPSPLPTAIPASITAPPEIQSACSSPATYPGLLVSDTSSCYAWWKCNQYLYPEYFQCPSGLIFDRTYPMRCRPPTLGVCYF